jgi:hypothetical protein
MTHGMMGEGKDSKGKAECCSVSQSSRAGRRGWHGDEREMGEGKERPNAVACHKAAVQVAGR